MFQTNGILEFLPIFQGDGFVFSTAHPAVQRDGYLTPVHNELSQTAIDFVQTLYESGAIDPTFMDKTLLSDDRSYQLRNDVDAINSASLFELGHVLTFLTRAERFTPGTITSAYNSGLLIQILKRLSVITQNHR